MIEIEFINSKENAIFVQVDPWACLYKLGKDHSITILAPITSEKTRFCIDECDSATSETRILTLLDCEEFFVVVDGKRVHWQDYQTNLPQQD